MQLQQSLYQALELYIEFIHRQRPQGRVEAPGTSNGMYHQDIHHALALGQRPAQSGEVVGHEVVVGPPGLLIVEVRGVVALARTAHGVEGEMGVEQVHSQEVEPVAHPLSPGEGEVLPRAAIGLAQGPPAPQLTSGGVQLLHRGWLSHVAPQLVNPRNVLVFVVGHSRADPLHLGAECILTHVVPGEGQAMLLAPPVHLLGKGLDETLGECVPEIVACLGRSGSVEEEVRQLAEEIIALLLPEVALQADGPGHEGLVRPGQDAVVVGGLIGKDAGYSPAELLTHLLAVALVGGLDESPHRLGVQEVNVAVVIEPGLAQRRNEGVELHQPLVTPIEFLRLLGADGLEVRKLSVPGC